MRIEFPKHKDKDGEELDCPVFLNFKNFNQIMRVLFVIYAESVNEDAAEIFVNSIQREVTSIYKEFKPDKKKQMTRKDEIAIQNAEICHICDKKLDNDKVLDHYHLTGKYRGAAHDYCNKRYQIPKFFPVLFHNLTVHDSHIFIKNLGVTEGLIKCIPSNEEKYISFTKDIEVHRYMEKDKKTGK